MTDAGCGTGNLWLLPLLSMTWPALGCVVTIHVSLGKSDHWLVMFASVNAVPRIRITHQCYNVRFL